MNHQLSILDLASIGVGESTPDSLNASVQMAQRAEEWGYQRIWYAEHHNMPTIASSATSVLIGQVAARTSRITLGAGGVMLPNHSPLTIAEQFGTLESFHPGRIELGLGRAPGSDQKTFRALRRDPRSSDQFPEDVLELQGYLGDETRIPGINATPGRGTHVPLYILGSSLFGAQLAAMLGLPYSFASHFAPDALTQAVALYRREFRPSEQLAEPRVIAGVNIVVADTTGKAMELAQEAKRRRVSALIGRGREFTDEEADMILDAPAGAHIRAMATHTGIGTADEVEEYLRGFATYADADELIVVSQAVRRDAWLRSLELLAPLNESGITRSGVAAQGS